MALLESVVPCACVLAWRAGAFNWSAVIEGGVWMAFVSNESTDDACEWFSGLIVGVGVRLLLEVPVIGLPPMREVAVGAAAAFAAGP